MPSSVRVSVRHGPKRSSAKLVPMLVGQVGCLEANLLNYVAFRKSSVFEMSLMKALFQVDAKSEAHYGQLLAPLLQEEGTVFAPVLRVRRSRVIKAVKALIFGNSPSKAITPEFEKLRPKCINYSFLTAAVLFWFWGGFQRLLPLGCPVRLYTGRLGSQLQGRFKVLTLSGDLGFPWLRSWFEFCADPGSPDLARTYRDGPHPDNARIEAKIRWFAALAVGSFSRRWKIDQPFWLATAHCFPHHCRCAAYSCHGKRFLWAVCHCECHQQSMAAEWIACERITFVGISQNKSWKVIPPLTFHIMSTSRMSSSCFVSWKTDLFHVCIFAGLGPRGHGFDWRAKCRGLPGVPWAMSQWARAARTSNQIRSRTLVDLFLCGPKLH